MDYKCFLLQFLFSYFRSPTESRRRHEEKQAKAQELRKKFLQDKADRLKELSKKVSLVTLALALVTLFDAYT